MNFDKAYKELLAGKKIRRKEWEPLMHIRIIDGEVLAFRGEHKIFYQDSNILTSDGWMVVDGDGKQMKFIDALQELRNKKCITRESMGDAFVFVDKDQLATCNPVKFDFMPTWRCLNSDDWSILK